MKEKWWQNELQKHNCTKTMAHERTFPVTKVGLHLWTKEKRNCSRVCLDDKTLLTSTENKKELWTEHFTQLLSETTTVGENKGDFTLLEYFVTCTFADVSAY